MTELTDLLKELVDRLVKLEERVYDENNVLMKAGLVKVDSPTPSMSTNNDGLPDADAISKMSWDDLNTIVKKIEG
tara:strand:+ start:453 stop:677 length:225 start_codon:yes stop_codon:yes gene_type:complete